MYSASFSTSIGVLALQLSPAVPWLDAIPVWPLAIVAVVGMYGMVYRASRNNEATS